MLYYTEMVLRHLKNASPDLEGKPVTAAALASFSKRALVVLATKHLGFTYGAAYKLNNAQLTALLGELLEDSDDIEPTSEECVVLAPPVSVVTEVSAPAPTPEPEPASAPMVETFGEVRPTKADRVRLVEVFKHINRVRPTADFKLAAVANEFSTPLQMAEWFHNGRKRDYSAIAWCIRGKKDPASVYIYAPTEAAAQQAERTVSELFDAAGVKNMNLRTSWDTALGYSAEKAG